MGKKALILGVTGHGKSHAIQFLDPKTTFVINPDNKELPWRGSERIYKSVMKSVGGVSYKSSNYAVLRGMAEIETAITIINVNRPDINCIVIDTLSHAMNRSVMDYLSVDGYAKYKLFANEFYTLMAAIDNIRPDLTVFIMAHVEVCDSIGEKKILQFQIPSGKFTREALVPESMFSVVLLSDMKMVDGKPQYFFRTQTNGLNTVKSPDGMFPPTIPNNLETVRERIALYYNSEESLPEMEEQVTADSF